MVRPVVVAAGTSGARSPGARYTVSVSTESPERFLDELYRAALLALQPGHAVRDGLAALDPSDRVPLHILAMGKAARTMAAAALDWCLVRGITVRGGVCISHDAAADPDDAALAPLGIQTGDHPVPGVRSKAAAEALAAYVRGGVRAGERVLVLLSGGTSALIGAPRTGTTDADYATCCRALLGAGLEIGAMNLLRRRLSMWGGGTLGAALDAAGAHTDVLAISDVPGSTADGIGGNPCLPDIATPEMVTSALSQAALTPHARRLIDEGLTRSDTASLPPCSPIRHDVIGSNAAACEAIVAAARERGAQATLRGGPLAGDAHACGIAIAAALLEGAAQARQTDDHAMRILCWGGEPTVAVPHGDAPPGGRMQALALAAAEVLAAAGDDGHDVLLLAAGTDGRDGTTDAAGAIVSAATWQAVRAAGRDPAMLLAAHRSHEALRAAHALIPAFTSGTNVNDLVVGLVRRDLRSL